MKSIKNVLLIGAHFDDSELGAGGTAAKLAHEGKCVYKVTLTDNVTEFEQRDIKVGFESGNLLMISKKLSIFNEMNFSFNKLINWFL